MGCALRLAIHVPMRQAGRWDPAPGFITWETFLRRVTDAAGNVSVLSAGGHSKGRDGYGAEPVYIVEALVPYPNPACRYSRTWALFREYARQLLVQGEESVLIVDDNEPSLIQ